MEALYLNSFRIALLAASAVKCTALPPPDDKVGAETPLDVGLMSVATLGHQDYIHGRLPEQQRLRTGCVRVASIGPHSKVRL
jgi:hypothetical protein